MPRERISACLIVQDEEARLPAALASLAFCDEIVVVDGGSRDRTRELAREAGAQVIENPWPGFAAQRNVAIDAATGDWILEVDADERISPPLRQSIEALLAGPPAPGEGDIAIFALRNRFLGGLLGPSAKYPAYRARLWRRGAYRHDEGRAVHEGVELRERPIVLDGDLEHELAGSLSEAVTDLLRYARLESAHIVAPSSSAAYVKAIVLRPAAKLAYRLLIEGGWRDGWRGFLKISLDVGSDVLVWLRVLRGKGSAEGATTSSSAGEHFGHRRVGPVKVLALASNAKGAATAAGKLKELRERGADVTLVAPRAPAGYELPFQPMRRPGPLSAIRALEIEMHVRPIDAVIATDARAQLLLKAVPGSLRPQSYDLEGTGELRWS
jgi:Glycosyl transferase family 2